MCFLGTYILVLEKDKEQMSGGDRNHKEKHIRVRGEAGQEERKDPYVGCSPLTGWSEKVS